MDVLVVVGDGNPTARLQARARRVVRVESGELTAETLADLRGHLPRLVGVTGGVDAKGAAEQLHHAGFAVVLYSDDVTELDSDISIRAVTDPGPPMEVADSLLDLVGDTPLVRLDRMGREIDCHLIAKVEFMNPGGSVKDRPAVAMIDAAEREGLLQPGGTIVEPTSGNTGVGLALVAARRGYRCIFVMPDKMSQEKIGLLRAYGAEVIVCPTAVDPDHPDSYYSVSDRLLAETPGAYKPSQYHNPENPQSHVDTTGPELWRQTAGRITHFVAGIGTGGTISGVGRYLKAQNPDIAIIGADPEGSVYSGGGGRPYLVEGIGEDFWPTTYDGDVVDRVIQVTDRDSFLTARRITREEGMLVGGSAGTAVWAAVEVGRELGPDDVMVVLIPDSGRGYLSKLYNDDWMADFGFLRVADRSAGDVLAAKRTDIPALVHVHPDETVRQAIAILREFEVSQLPVLKAEPPVVLAELVGSVRDRDLMDLAFHDDAVLDRPVGEVMDDAIPTVGAGEPAEMAVTVLEDSPAVVVIDAGHPIGVLTRSDVLEFLSKTPGR